MPAIPLTHLGDTGWMPVWVVYPYFAYYLLNAADYLREVFLCVAVIVAHLGVSFGIAAAIDTLISRPKDKC